LVGRRVLDTFDAYQAEIRKLGEHDEWARAIAGEVRDRAEEDRRIAYMRWNRRMEQLRLEFKLAVVKLNEYSREIVAQVREYDLLNQQQWENLCDGLSVARTWFFTLDIRRGQMQLRYFFFFGRHYWSDLDDSRDRAEPRVALLVSESDGVSEATRLDQLDKCPIGLRELFVVDNDLVRKRVDFTNDAHVYDREVEPGVVAREFLQDVVFSRLT
jgi:hypothetical protein